MTKEEMLGEKVRPQYEKAATDLKEENGSPGRSIKRPAGSMCGIEKEE